MNSTAKTILFWVMLLLAAVLLYQVFTLRQGGSHTALTFSSFLDELDKGNIKDVTITDSRDSGSVVTGHLKSPVQPFRTVLPIADPELIDKLRDKNVTIIGGTPHGSPWLAALFSWVLPMVFIVGFWIFFMRQARRLGNRNPGALFPLAQSPALPQAGVVANADAAIGIATIVWLSLYGAETIESQKPLRAELKNGVWIVSGRLTTDQTGLSAFILQADGRILAVGPPKE